MVIGSQGVSTRPIPSRGQLTIGRAEDAAVRLEGARVSRRHALLQMHGTSFTIEDLDSANGTVVHDQRLPARQPVAFAPGDAIHIGDFVLIVRAFYATDPLGIDTGPSPGDGGLGGLPAEVVLRSPAVLASYGELTQAARSDLNVLILGETGVGKDVLARCLHHLSNRRTGPFLRVNCAALTESLLESELFGHEKGAFTGAVTAKQGLFESAAGGTVFLDEIGEFPAALQPKLLQVVENHEVLRVGSVRPISVDVRFVAATNRDLEEGVAAGRFRSDLYYRLSGFTVVVPPLRDRPEDVLPLAEEFMRRMAEKAGLARPPVLDREVAALLLGHTWPGNVRELRNVVDRAMVLAGGGPLHPAHLRLGPPRAARPDGGGRPAPPPPLEDEETADSVGQALELSDAEVGERQRIIDALVRCKGNQSRAARALGISRSTLLNRLDAYRISRPRKRPRRPV